MVYGTARRLQIACCWGVVEVVREHAFDREDHDLDGGIKARAGRSGLIE
jgi:hypothetical protein